MADLVRSVPPNSLEAEQRVLTPCFMPDADDVIAEVVSRLADDDFYHPANQAIFRAIRAVSRKTPRVPVDYVTVKEALGDLVGEVVGLEYLVDMASPDFLSGGAVDYYIGKVADLSRRRKFIRIAYEAMAEAYDVTSEDPIGGHYARLLGLDLATGHDGGWKKLADVHRENYEAMEEAHQATVNGEPTRVVDLGFHDLDNFINITAGDVVVIAAKTGFGKTALATAIARHVSTHSPVAMFTLEMNRQAMSRRWTAMETGIEVGRQMKGALRENEWPLVAEMIERNEALDLYIRDKSQTTVSEMLAACRQLEARLRRKLGAVVVDYLTLADVDGKTENETTRASKVSRQIKMMAQELGCPVFALAQLNRGIDGRESKRPELRDLKQSGSIEQDASVVMFIHRQGHIDGQPLEAGPVEVIVAKHRNGPTGSAELYFDPKRTTFTNYHGPHAYNAANEPPPPNDVAWDNGYYPEGGLLK